MGKKLAVKVKSPEAEHFADTVKTTTEQIGGFVPDFFEQLVGFSLNGKTSPEANLKTPDQPLIIKDPVTGQIDVFHAAKHQKQETPKIHADKAPKSEKQGEKPREAAIDYHGDFLRSSEKASLTENREINERLQQIMEELKRLIGSSKVLQAEFADVNMDRTPPQVGEYHLNFFDWLLLTIRTAREKVEDSGAWLATAKSKSGKKGGYWSMFKKHGTSFGLSNERTAATQTG